MSLSPFDQCVAMFFGDAAQAVSVTQNQCIKLFISKLLGVAIIAGSFVVKVPQVRSPLVELERDVRELADEGDRCLSCFFVWFLSADR
jgi:hypothetical protein